MLPQKIVKHIFATLAQNNPQPTTELIYTSDFELLIAVILSAQATDISVNKVTKELFAHAHTPAQILHLGLEQLKWYIKSIGLYNTKASNIIKTCAILIEQYNGAVPDKREALESLPGVGRKTANVILNTIFNQPVIAVDTHVMRVASRLGLSDGRTPLAIELDLYKIIPLQYLSSAHHWLILHGRYTCQARKPACGQCAVSKWCMFLHSS
jgi:endonuclease-3